MCYLGLLLPHERDVENPPEEKPKKKNRGYKKRSKEVLREIRFAKSIVNGLNESVHLLVFDDLYLTSILLTYREKMVLDDDELISPEELSLKAREVSFNLIFSSVGGC